MMPVSRAMRRGRTGEKYVTANSRKRESPRRSAGLGRRARQTCASSGTIHLPMDGVENASGQGRSDADGLGPDELSLECWLAVLQDQGDDLGEIGVEFVQRRALLWAPARPGT